MARDPLNDSHIGDTEVDHVLADNQACNVCQCLEELFVTSDFKKDIGVFGVLEVAHTTCRCSGGSRMGLISDKHS